MCGGKAEAEKFYDSNDYHLKCGSVECGGEGEKRDGNIIVSCCWFVANMKYT